MSSGTLLTEERFLQLLDGALEKRLEPIRQDIAVLKEDVAGLKHDVAILKEDVSGLKHDVAILKIDMKKVKADIVQLTGFQTHEVQAIEDDFNKLLKKHLQREYPKMTVGTLGIKKMKNPFVIDRTETLTDFDAGYLLSPYKHVSDISRLVERSIPIPSREKWLDMSYICVIAEAKHYISRDKIQQKLYQFDIFSKACLLAKDILNAPEELRTAEHFGVNESFIASITNESYIAHITDFILFFGAAYWQRGVFDTFSTDVSNYKEYLTKFASANGDQKIRLYKEVLRLENKWYGNYQTPNKPLSDEDILALESVNGAMKYVEFIVQSGERFTVAHTNAAGPSAAAAGGGAGTGASTGNIKTRRKYARMYTTCQTNT
jgi:hypothetical protein